MKSFTVRDDSFGAKLDRVFWLILWLMGVLVLIFGTYKGD